MLPLLGSSPSSLGDEKVLHCGIRYEANMIVNVNFVMCLFIGGKRNNVADVHIRQLTIDYRLIGIDREFHWVHGGE